jgi:Tfp pilus assembly protein PilF
VARQARALMRAGEHREAIAQLERVVAVVPDEHDPRRDLAHAYYNAGRMTDALRETRELAERFPARSDAANNLATVLLQLDRPREAFAAAERAIGLDPGNVSAMHNLAEILKHLGDWEGSRDVYAAALTLAPHHAKARMQYGMKLVALGDWPAGWAALEAREEAIGRSILYRENPPTPRWDGVTDLAGRHLLIQHEQGLGDAIMGVRFAETLAARGAVVHVRCPAPLVPLLTAAPGVATCTAVGSPFPRHELHVPLMSLMHVLQITPADLHGRAYLTPSGDCPPHLTALLPRDGIPTVALAWAGNPLHINDHRRSIRGALLAPVLDLPAVRFVAMQKTPSMISALPESLQPRLLDVGAACATFQDSAHALRRVDLVISVDSAVAHLAGALGIPTLLCLPFCPDYRWGVQGERTPWYDRVTLLRQDESMRWEPVIDRVTKCVAALRRAPLSPGDIA